MFALEDRDVEHDRFDARQLPGPEIIPLVASVVASLTLGKIKYAKNPSKCEFYLGYIAKDVIAKSTQQRGEQIGLEPLFNQVGNRRLSPGDRRNFKSVSESEEKVNFPRLTFEYLPADLPYENLRENSHGNRNDENIRQNFAEYNKIIGNNVNIFPSKEYHLTSRLESEYSNPLIFQTNNMKIYNSQDFEFKPYFPNYGIANNKNQVSKVVSDHRQDLKNNVYQNQVVNSINDQSSVIPITSQEYWDKLLDTKTVIAGVDIVDIDKST